MEKGNKRKATIRAAAKALILEKGYTAVTMTDVGERLKLSVGGLYYHYRSVEEILIDIIDDETKNVWELFADVENIDGLLRRMDEYFELEKRDMRDFNNSLNCILFQYYFSFAADEREKKMNAAYRETIDEIRLILRRVYKDPDEVFLLANHIYAAVHGLNVVAMSGEITDEIINFEFAEIKRILIKFYGEQKL
ncbi:MAG: TetR/AcrR family transcriptional regulator [Bacteroides sp.]|nr:TetR/AcrR family transcriptional regulator [Eubacterium sp.]MCM1419207.1 TetR/AcrR family transcriptional regulator [Roseburia sp.]MCM1463500.1 TetR/AcrR family transcriptional regulator [Bacteroides sp.]